MIGFLTPLWLALAAAAAVPIVLHLLHRHYGPRIVFPALRYLRRAERENARRIRLRQFLLLALRVATAILLALAVARPFIRSDAGSHEPTAVALIVDNSLSSGAVVEDRRVLDELQRRALETLESATPDDRFWLIQAGAPWRAAAMGDATATAERVRGLMPTAAAADLDPAIARAAALLASGSEGRAPEIHLLGDLQATGFRQPVPAQADAPPLVIWRSPAQTPRNAAIVDVEVGGGLPPRAGERTTVSATLHGNTSEDDSLAVRLVVDGRVVAASRAAGPGSVLLSFPPREAGLVTGYVEIDADALRADDRRYFVTRVQPPPRVTLTRPAPFVSDALDVLAEARRIELVTGAADVVLAPAGQGAENPAADAVVLIPPDSPLELPAFNQRLASAGVPWRLGTPAAAGEARFAEANDDAELLQTLGAARLRLVYPLEPASGNDGGPPAGSTTLLGLADGAPWAVAGETTAGRRYVLIASPLTEEATSLPTSTAMLPLLDRMLGPWAQSVAPRAEVQPGQPIPLPEGAEYVQRPDGRLDPVSGASAYYATDDAGIYQIMRGGEVQDAVAVNPPARESALDAMDDDGLRAALPGWDIRIAEDPGQWLNAIFQRRQGREVWRVLLLLAIMALLLESAIAASGRASAERPAAAPVAAPEEAGAGPRPSPRPAAPGRRGRRETAGADGQR